MLSIIEGELSNCFVAEHNDNFAFDSEEEVPEKLTEIENNFLYNIPNIICYFYEELGDEIRPLIYKLAQLYQDKT